MLDKLHDLKERFELLTDQLMRPGLKPADLQTLSKERAQLEPLVNLVTQLESAMSERADNELLLEDSDAEMRAMAHDEIGRLGPIIEMLEEQIRVLLVPRDPLDQKNVILEVRGGTGGDEAALFAGDLFQMYARFAERMRWKVEIMSTSEGTRGGFKEVVASITGDQVYSWLRFEAGVHRVQRVPDTETQGRIHTSAVTVAVLPEAEEVDIEINTEDLRIDTYRAGGAGGQHVNKTESAIRITHMPSGVVVACQAERSQMKNRATAMKMLRARLYEMKQAQLDAERSADRKAMVKSGDRSDKIRTYNFPQDRCTDHRVGVTVHNLPKLFAGDMQELLTEVRAEFQAEALKAQADSE